MDIATVLRPFVYAHPPELECHKGSILVQPGPSLPSFRYLSGPPSLSRLFSDRFSLPGHLQWACLDHLLLQLSAKSASFILHGRCNWVSSIDLYQYLYRLMHPHSITTLSNPNAYHPQSPSPFVRDLRKPHLPYIQSPDQHP
jgi:hypothetical protein